MSSTQPQRSDTEPYCKFKDDRSRLHALVSRDIRIVLVVAIALFASAPLQSTISKLGSALVAVVSR